MFDGAFEMWKREGKLCWERERVIDDDLAGSVMNGRKRTITMTNQHRFILKGRGDGQKMEQQVKTLWRARRGAFLFVFICC
jgi:hypothetical protein